MMVGGDDDEDGDADGDHEGGSLPNPMPCVGCNLVL